MAAFWSLETLICTQIPYLDFIFVKISIYSLNMYAKIIIPDIVWNYLKIFSSGSVYEMHGQECCLSTGEIIKVTGFQIVKVKVGRCELIEGNNSSPAMELPLDYPGMFIYQSYII